MATDPTPPTAPSFEIEVTQMEWGEWRATAIKLGFEFHRTTFPDGKEGWTINDDCLPIDGPYRETKDAAVAALMGVINGKQ